MPSLKLMNQYVCTAALQAKSHILATSPRWTRAASKSLAVLIDFPTILQQQLANLWRSVLMRTACETFGKLGIRVHATILRATSRSATRSIIVPVMVILSVRSGRNSRGDVVANGNSLRMTKPY